MTSTTLARPVPSATWAALGFGIAGAGALHALPDLLLRGGGSALVVFAAGTMAVGLPTALLRWQGDDAEPPAWLEEGWRAALWMTAACALAEPLAAVHQGPVVGAPVGLLLWGLLAFAARPGSAHLVAAAMVAATGLMAVVPLVAQPDATLGSPWTLLRPRWSSWEAWTPEALRAGMLAALVLPGWWAASHRRRPSGLGAPWRVAAVAVLLAAAAGVVAGVAYETLPTPTYTPAKLLLPLGAVAALATVLDASRRELVVAATMTVWLVGPGHAAIDWWWSLLLPLLLAGSLVVATVSDVVRPRWATLPAALLLLVVCLYAAPTIPSQTAPAVGAALAVVAWVWAAGLRIAARVS
jgi:hypothetical protein